MSNVRRASSASNEASSKIGPSREGRATTNPTAPAATTETSNVPAEFTARMFPDVPHENVNVELEIPHWDRGEIGDYLEIGVQKEILYINGDAGFATSKLIVGDRIMKLNDKTSLSIEEMKEILHQDGKANVVVLRRRGFSPVPPARMESLHITPSSGFTYALLTVTRLPDEPLKADAMGFVGRVINNKVILSKIINNTPAVNWLAVGDALLDINGTAIPFNQQDFVHQFWTHFKGQGTFTAVVERPCSAEALEAINALIASLYPIGYEQVHMTSEAATIGAHAAKQHKEMQERRPPGSILRPPPAPVPITPHLAAYRCKSYEANLQAKFRKARSADSGKNGGMGKGQVTQRLQPSSGMLRNPLAPRKGKRDETSKKIYRNEETTKELHVRWNRNTEHEIGTEVPDGRKLKKVDKKVKGKRGILSIFDLF